MSSRNFRRILTLVLFVGAALLPYAEVAEARSRDGKAAVFQDELSASTFMLSMVDFLRVLAVKRDGPPPCHKPDDDRDHRPGHHSPPDRGDDDGDEGGGGCPHGRPGR
jgi:hypothetical protein